MWTFAFFLTILSTKANTGCWKIIFWLCRSTHQRQLESLHFSWELLFSWHWKKQCILPEKTLDWKAGLNFTVLLHQNVWGWHVLMKSLQHLLSMIYSARSAAKSIHSRKILEAERALCVFWYGVLLMPHCFLVSVFNERGPRPDW